MRDIFVTILFFSGVLLALRRPFVAALLWTWIGLMNPHRLGWGFAYSFPFGMAAAAVLFLSILINREQVRWPRGATVVILLIFVSWVGITSLMAIVPDESMTRYVKFLKVMMMTLVVAAVVRTRAEILTLTLVSAMSIAFFGLKGGLFTLLSGGGHLVWGPPSSVIEGNNELAVALIITVPLLYFLSQQATAIRELAFFKKIPEKWLRRGFAISMMFCLVSALGSHSRGALLAMIAMGVMLWWRSKSKLMFTIIAMIMVVMALAFMPDDWTNRMNTIQTYEEDESAMGRINAWTMAINIANDRFFGAGLVTDSPAIYQRYAPNPNFVIVAHSIYFQVLGEHGYFGLLLYLSFWISAYSLAGRIVKLAATREDLQWAKQLALMSRVSLAGFAVGGAFLSLAYWDMPFYIMVLLLCTERLVRDQCSKRSLVAAKSTALPHEKDLTGSSDTSASGVVPSELSNPMREQ